MSNNVLPFQEMNPAQIAQIYALISLRPVSMMKDDIIRAFQ